MAVPSTASKKSRTPGRLVQHVERQLLWSVAEERRCLFHVDGRFYAIRGYLAGMDSFQYLIVDANDQSAPSRRVVHKGHVSVIDLEDEPTMDDEMHAEKIRAIVAPYRRVVKQLLGISDS